MRMSRERLFALADRIVADLTATESVVIRGAADDKVHGQLRTEVFRVLEDESRAREVVHRILVEDLQAEAKLDADARTLMQDHAKEIKNAAYDYKRLFALVRAKLAKERGFTL